MSNCVDFGATKRTHSLKAWGESLEEMVDLNGYDFDFTEAEIEAGYESYRAVSDFFYDHFEPCEE